MVCIAYRIQECEGVYTIVVLKDILVNQHWGTIVWLANIVNMNTRHTVYTFEFYGMPLRYFLRFGPQILYYLIVEFRVEFIYIGFGIFENIEGQLFELAR